MLAHRLAALCVGRSSSRGGGVTPLNTSLGGLGVYIPMPGAGEFLSMPTEFPHIRRALEPLFAISGEFAEPWESIYGHSVLSLQACLLDRGKYSFTRLIDKTTQYG